MFDFNDKGDLAVLEMFQDVALTQVNKTRPQNSEALFDFLKRVPKWFFYKGAGTIGAAKDHFKNISDNYKKSKYVIEHDGVLAPFLDEDQLDAYIDFVGLGRVAEECNYVFCKGISYHESVKSFIYQWRQQYPDDWVEGSHRKIRRLDQPLMLKAALKEPVATIPTKPVLTTIQEVKTVIQEPIRELSPKELVEKFRNFVSKYNVNVKCELANGGQGFECSVVQGLWVDTSTGSIQEFHTSLRALEETGLGKLENGFWITTAKSKPSTPVVSDEEIQVGTERKIKIPTVKIEPQTVSLELIENSLKDKGWISAESFVSQYGDQRPVAKRLLQTLHKEGKLDIDTQKKLLKLK